MKVAPIHLLLIFTLFSCTPDPAKQVRTYEKAHNDHDVNKVMSLYTDDIIFEITGSWRKSGRDQVHGLAEWDSVTGSNMIISDIVEGKDTVRFRLKEKNDWFRAIGIEYMYYDPCIMVFSGGLIKELKATVTEESSEAFRVRWPLVYQWLSMEKEPDMTRLIANGEFVYNAENANKWLLLLKEWQLRR